MTLPALLLFSVALSAAPSGPAPPDTLAATRTHLLGGHITVALPVGMKIEARRADLMSAPAPDQDETRAVLDVGKVRLVMMANERYAFASGDPRAAVQADLAKGFPKAKLEALTLAQPLRGYGAAITLPEVGEANLVYVAYLINADGSVQQVAFYVNPEGTQHAADWTALARKIAASASAGARHLDAKGGARALGPLRITLPQGWVTHSQPGPDFAVYRLTKLTPLGSSPLTCGIYLGGYPAFQFRQAGIDASQTRQVKGALLGGVTEWVVWRHDGRSETEAMAKHAGQRVHVFCSADAEADLAGLRQLAATLRWR